MRILYISHDASVTGAPILLLNLLKVLKSLEKNIEIIIRVKQGALLTEFELLGNVYYWQEGGKRFGIVNRVRDKVRWAIRRNKIRHLAGRCNFVFSNTATNGDVLEFIKKCNPSIPVYSYVHELKLGFEQFVSPAELQKLKLFTDTFIIPSEAVRTFLEQQIVSAERAKSIGKLNYFIPKANTLLNGGKRERFAGKFIVGTCGTTDWRKGADLFLAIAQWVSQLDERGDILFYWRGGYAGLLDTRRFVFQIEQAGLQHRVVHEEASTDMESFFNAIDLYLLPSREDPYPLVVLEAAGYYKPSVCFQGGGGAVEFVADDAGTIVPYLDIKAAGEAIIHYKMNPELLKTKGMKAQEKLALLHQDENLIVEQFKEICYAG